MPRDKHFHTRRPELEVFWIPADEDIPCQLKVLVNSRNSLQNLIGGYITNYPGGWYELPEFECGCLPALMLDEEGILKRLPQNPRANKLLTHGAFQPILGDALVIGRGPVARDEYDLWGLPEAMKNWEGPGTVWPNC